MSAPRFKCSNCMNVHATLVAATECHTGQVPVYLWPCKFCKQNPCVHTVVPEIFEEKKEEAASEIYEANRQLDIAKGGDGSFLL